MHMHTQLRILAAASMAAGLVHAQNIWNGSGVGSNTGSNWDDTAGYQGGSAVFSSSTDLDFSRITQSGATTLSNSAGGAYSAKDLLFGTTSSTISAAEVITLAGNGTAGATTLNLAGNISLPSPASSRAILAGDLTLNLSNSAHLVRFFQNNNVIAAPAANTSSFAPVLVFNALITGGGSGASINNSFTAYGLTPPSTALSLSPALVFTNNANTFDAKIGASSGISQRLSYTSIANAGEASSLGAGTGANAVIQLSNGSAFDYIGTGDQTSNRAFNYASTLAVENLAAGGNTTVTFNGTFTNVGASAATLRVGATAGNTLVFDTVIADGASSVTRITALGGTSSPYYKSDGTTATALFTNGKVVLNGLNTYTGVTTLDGGIVVVTTFADINTASGLGRGSAAGSAADLVFGGGTLQHVAANTASTNRLFTVGDTNSNTATLDSSAAADAHSLSFTSSGAIAFGNTSAHTLNLTGTNTGDNLFAPSFGTNASGTNVNSLSKSGSGTWILGGANTYTGATTVQANGGILVYAGTAAKSAGSAVTVNNGGFIGFRVGGSGFFGSSDLNTVFQAPNSVATSGYTFTSGAGVAIDTTQGDFTYATSQTSLRNLAKIGANALVLTGTSTYNGVSVRKGSLVVNGGLTGAVTVLSGATLGGSGVINSAATIAAGGTLAPGNSPGNLTFNNGLALAGTYVWELGALSTSGPGTNFDTVTVTAGNVDLTGATLTLSLGVNAPSAVAFWQTDQTWSGIINNTGAGSVTGSFAAIDNSAWSSLGGFSTQIVGNDVNLVWTAASAVPEPSAFAFIGGFAALGLAAVRRRRAPR